MAEIFNRLLLLDLDGTIREPLNGEKFIQHPRDQRIIKGADKALAHYHTEEWLIIGISNQGGVAALHKTLEDALEEQRYTLEMLPQMQEILICTEYPPKDNYCYIVTRKNLLVCDNYSQYRKPGTGMIQCGIERTNPVQVWMVGDRHEDEAAANAAGVNFMWADIWRDRWTSSEYKIN